MWSSHAEVYCALLLPQVRTAVGKVQAELEAERDVLQVCVGGGGRANKRVCEADLSVVGVGQGNSGIEGGQ